MKGIEIFKIIKALSPREKARFSKSIGNQKADYFILFKALNRMNAYDEGKLKVKTELLKTPQRYYYAKNTLIDKLIVALISQKGASSNPVEYIQEALKWGLVEVAERKLNEEADKAVAQQNSSYLRFLLQFKTELEVHLEINLHLSGSIPSLSVLRKEDAIAENLLEIKRMVLQELKSKGATDQFRISTIEKRLEENRSSSKFNGYLFLKNQVLLQLLQNDQDSAFQTYIHLIDYLESQTFPYREKYQIKELSSFSFLAGELGYHEKVQEVIFSLSSLGTSNPILDRYREKQLVKVLLQAALNL